MGNNKEHCTSTRNNHPEVSAAAEHVINQNHTINWDQPRVIACNQHTTCRKVYKALAIHTQKEHTMDRDTGLELKKCWLNLVTKKKKTVISHRLYCPLHTPIFTHHSQLVANVHTHMYPCTKA